MQSVILSPLNGLCNSYYAALTVLVKSSLAIIYGQHRSFAFDTQLIELLMLQFVDFSRV